MAMKPDIQVVDVSARDGLQNEAGAAAISADTKVDYIRRLMQAGLKRIEAGSFVKPSAVPSMANSGEVAEKLAAVQAAHPDVIFSYLVPNLKGLERAKAIGAKEVAVFLAISEAFSKANINQTVVRSFKDIEPVVKEALKHGIRVRGYLSTVFGYDDLPFNPESAAVCARQLLDMGCYEVSLGDTTGIATPEKVVAVIEALNARRISLSKIAMHFHDTFGGAIANVDKSYDLGIRTFDAATGGLGGCPYANSPKGNLAMEDLVRWCRARNVSCDVTNTEQLVKAGAFMLQKLGKKNPAA
jgi:hydroxymethylglutaryl-CoA lyase